MKLIFCSFHFKPSPVPSRAWPLPSGSRVKFVIPVEGCGWLVSIALGEDHDVAVRYFAERSLIPVAMQEVGRPEGPDGALKLPVSQLGEPDKMDAWRRFAARTGEERVWGFIWDFSSARAIFGTP